MKEIKFKNILDITTFIIFFYIIIYLGWENSINSVFNVEFLISIGIFTSILHFFVFFDKRIEENYKSMTFFSLAILITPIIFYFLKNFIFNKYFVDYKIFLFVSLILYSLIRIAYFMRIIYINMNNPIIIFVISFFFLSLLGAILLMLPASTVNKISFIDALFTSTSAVCVTGLIVLDTAKDFTHLGKVILLILIELGGLGILTITSFLNYFFQDGFSFKEAVFISNFLNIKTTNNVLNFAVKVVLFTLFVEFIGTILIYLSIKNIKHDIVGFDSPIFFSIFHSISAFCNSGFSTLSKGLYSLPVRFNYLLQTIISILLILGGIGFNILFNFFTYIWLTLKKYFYKFFKDENIRSPVHIVTLNTRIVVYTTILLLVFGTIFYYISEYNTTLLEHPTVIGKLTVSFFSSATPRTAGFNVLNMDKITSTTIVFTIFLMWIGASPSSTGGGIKTSTFALAIMNVISLIKGKNRLEIQKREISSYYIQLAFSIIILSLITIYIGILFILFLDPKENILSIFFEVFSAFSTSGLSLGVTKNLSIGSKLILILLMLLGRIGIFNVMISLSKRNKINYNYYYKFPKGNILIT
ncbi:TrkH family potassium uptake protein [Blattabacterium cuenoti]|uniref:TrkH family potassium uptake protein n=1 Tax=Blattabacterium cuenoti TaxID=1653831 RepID=UPI00163CC47C|nr:potassium transporter TrkG [Blattabacterium cuenoti]